MSERLQQLLDAHHTWPVRYTFKFVVAQQRVSEVLALFPGESHEERPSQRGSYVAVTVKPVMASAQAVLEIYERAARIEGILCL